MAVPVGGFPAEWETEGDSHDFTSGVVFNLAQRFGVGSFVRVDEVSRSRRVRLFRGWRTVGFRGTMNSSVFLTSRGRRCARREDTSAERAGESATRERIFHRIAIDAIKNRLSRAQSDFVSPLILSREARYIYSRLATRSN